MTAELQSLLQETSRSFYLTVRVLPGSVRSQIGIAYLLARASDTVADTEMVPVSERRATLSLLLQRVLGESRSSANWSDLAAAQTGSASPGERRLLLRMESVFDAFDRFDPLDQQLIRQVISTIISGQDLDLQRFGEASAGAIVGLESDNELNDYTYRVAGCVGEFWTRLTRTKCFPSATIDDAQFLANGIQFGCGLQLVNILRDLPRDLANGRCYLPRAELSAVGVLPFDLTLPATWDRVAPVYRRWRLTALRHLEAGWRYTQQIPRNCFRLRLACAWPVLLGVQTLARLEQVNPLEPRSRVKVSRADVRRTLLGSLWRLPFPGPWDRQFVQAKSVPRNG